MIALVSIICLSLVGASVSWQAKRRRRRRRAASARTRSEIELLVGMTSIHERNFVRQYAAQEFKGEGAIVDLGCWMGSFTLPLAMGLRENPRISEPGIFIHAYDLFRWQDWMDLSVTGTRWEGRYREGDDFSDAFVEQIAPVADLVTMHAGDLNKKRWDAAEPIEYLVIDAMKSWELANSVVSNFFPALRPGLSFVHHQDFVHFFTPWIHLLMYRFRDYFEPRAYVPDGSFVFAYREQVPATLLEKRYSFADFSNEEATSAFAYSLGLIPVSAQANVHAARIMMHIHRSDKIGARAELERVVAAGIPLQKELIAVAQLLENEGG
jgi:hypothetical protein